MRPLFCFAAVGAQKTKKAEVTEHPEVFRHVGLLCNGSPDTVGLPLI